MFTLEEARELCIKLAPFLIVALLPGGLLLAPFLFTRVKRVPR